LPGKCSLIKITGRHRYIHGEIYRGSHLSGFNERGRKTLWKMKSKKFRDKKEGAARGKGAVREDTINPWKYRRL